MLMEGCTSSKVEFIDHLIAASRHSCSFTLDDKSVLNETLGGILGDTQC